MSLLKGAVAGLVGVAVVAALAGPAMAHAVLAESAPADRSVLEQPPQELVLRFNEPVSVPPGGIGLYDQDADRLPLGADAAAAPEELALPVEASLPDGTYILTWRVVSADGHVIRGAFQFSVGEEAEVDEGTFAAIFSDASANRWTAAAAIVRTVAFLGALLAVGVAFFLARVWRRPARGQQPGGPAADINAAVDRRLRRMGTWAASGAAVAAVTLVGVQAGSLAERGLAGMVDGQVLGEVVGSAFGLGMGLRIVALIVLAALLATTSTRALRAAVGTGVVVVVSFLLVGHSAVTAPRWFAWLADGVHVGAAAVWFGGLVALGAVLWWQRRDVDATASATAVARYSQVAAGALAAVGASGVGLAWLEVRALRALLTTPYGQLLLAKLVIVALIVGVAAYNRYRLLPAVRDVEQRATGRRLLRRTVTAEAGLMVAVLAVTAVLVTLQPAREAAGVGGVFATEAAMGDRTLSLTVDPNRAGRNEIHLYLLDETGRPSEAEDLTLRFSMPAEEIGPLERDPIVAGPGHWLHSGPEMQIPGTWQIEAVVTVSRFEREAVTVTLTVNP